jgi:prolyl oligopeptidase
MKEHLKVLLGAIITILPISTTQAGQEVDPYLWLEEVRGEKPLEWAKAHSEATLSVLQAQPGFHETYAKTLEVLDSDVRIPYPQFEGKYLYNFWKDKNNERGLWRRTTLAEYRKPAPMWEVLLDIDKLSRAEGEQWVFKGAEGLYPEYRLFMVHLSRGGGDAVVLREFDADTKQASPCPRRKATFPGRTGTRCTSRPISARGARRTRATRGSPSSGSGARR